MALVRNPATGAMEEDGQPVIPGAVQLPAHESSTATTVKLPAPQLAEGTAALKTAGADVEQSREDHAIATGGLSSIAQDEAKIDVAGASGEEAIGRLGAIEKRQIEEETAAGTAERLKGINEAARAEAEALKAKGEVAANHWSAKGLGRAFAALLIGLNAGARALQGKDGRTDVERIIDDEIGASEKRALAAWEALDATKKLRKDDYAAYLAERAKRVEESVGRTKTEIELFRAKVDKAKKGLAPEKAKLLAEQAEAAFQKAEAREDQKLAQQQQQLGVALAGTRTEKVTDRDQGGKANKPTEGDKNAAARLSLTEGNIKTIEENLGKVKPDELARVARQERLVRATDNPKGAGDALVGEGMRAIGIVPEGVLEGVGAETRAVINAMNEFVESALTSATGAAYSDDQKRAFRQSYGYAAGDTVPQLREKVARQKDWTKAERLKAGALGATVPAADAPGKAAAPAQKPPPKAPVDAPVSAEEKEYLRGLSAVELAQVTAKAGTLSKALQAAVTAENARRAKAK